MQRNTLAGNVTLVSGFNGDAPCGAAWDIGRGNGTGIVGRSKHINADQKIPALDMPDAAWAAYSNADDGPQISASE